MKKKITITENQYNRIFLTEYLDKNYGIPLYRYLNMSYKDELKCMFDWGIDNDMIEKYYNSEDGFDNLYGYAVEKIEEKYNDDFESEEEKENIINDYLNDLYSDLTYDMPSFISIVKNNYNLCSDLYNYLCVKAKEDVYEAPAFLFFSQPRLIKNEWLVHFSDNAYMIAKDGFKYGTQDLDRLAYTGCGDIENKFGEGYDFAYTSDAAMDVFYSPSMHWENPKYGSEFVMFRASGVEAWHDGDEERQVIFYGPSAKDIIYIRKDSPKGEIYYRDLWQVCDVKNGRIIYETESLEDVVDWVKNNYVQYKNRIVSKNKNQDYERKYV